MRSEESLATVLLVGRLASGGLQPLKASEFWALRDQVGEVRTLLGRSERVLIEDDDLSPPLARRVAGLLGRATAVAFEVERLDQSGISTLTPSDDAYPRRLVDRLGPKAPPVLHAAGAIELLAAPGVGVVGDREPAAAAIAGLAAVRGLPLVTADLLAFDPTGISVVWVLADSLVRSLRRPDARRAVYRGSIVACTPFGPDSPRGPGYARGRDRLVYGLARSPWCWPATASRATPGRAQSRRLTGPSAGWRCGGARGKGRATKGWKHGERRGSSRSRSSTRSSTVRARAARSSAG